MAFKLTYATMFNPPEELHKGFDAAVVRLKQNLGKEYGMIIDGQDVFADEKLEDRLSRKHRLGAGADAEGHAGARAAGDQRGPQGLPGWSRTPWQERVRLVRKAASIIEKRIFDLGAAMALEVGKNRMESLGDVQETADLMSYSALMMEQNKGFIRPMGKDPLVGYDATNISVLRAYGVWLVVSPFNFPFALTGGPTGAALVAGNTVVIKPATDTAWIVRLYAECLQRCRLSGGRGQLRHWSGLEPGAGAWWIARSSTAPRSPGSFDVGHAAVPRFCAAATTCARWSWSWAVRIRPSSRGTPTSPTPRRASCAPPSVCRARSAQRPRGSWWKSRSTTSWLVASRR